ncbi:MAG TPA: SCO family protein [Bacteroidales bacterium]|nr:SCO family protein [Bacteroidales bacterium]HSA44837.1 SCO family protein [Bacteroidales bacterium]
MRSKLVVLFLLALFSRAESQENVAMPANDPEIGIVEHLDTILSPGIMVIGETGDTVPLLSLINKPTILNLVYYRCPGICSPIMNSLAEVVDKLDMVIGKDYQILTVSFDAREDISLAVKKKQNYINMVKKEIDPAGWQFMTADSLDIANLCNTVGFRFKIVGNDFLHPGMIAVFSPQGKLTRYLFGTYFLPFEVKLALAEANKGLSGPTINRVLQFCYTYDPQGRQYVLNVTKVSGILILAIGLIVILVLILKPKRKNHQQ